VDSTRPLGQESVAAQDYDVAAAVQRVGEAEAAADLDFLMENAPRVLDGALEGLRRIATIVRSMKEFAHPDQAQKSPADLNQAIRSTLVIANNEYKYVAEGVTELADLPLVPCYLGEINQVVLNSKTECGKGTTFFIRLPVGERIAERGIEQDAA
jgi:signal transduction histidine kinase